MIQKTKVKQYINAQGCRISPDAFDGINRAVETAINQMLSSVKADGMKTLMIQHTGTPQLKQEESSGSCKRCCNIKDMFIQWARTTQAYCCEQAVILSRKVRR